MLRSILRNVQHYLLFFSILLVLLAFQRLQWYDQGLLAQPYGFDGPRYTSPDTAGRVFGAEGAAKEIGLFKFRLGLFHFALPTFSKDAASWERTSELSSLMSVPLPPNQQRKTTKKVHARLKGRVRLQSNSSPGQGQQMPERDAAPKATIAYVVVLPRSLSPATINLQVLPKSIRRAHADSSYRYQLYALELNNADEISKLRWEELPPDFQRIHLGEVGEGMKPQADHSAEDIDVQPLALHNILQQHDIVVQMSPNSFLLQPLENIFDDLLAVKERKASSEEEMKNVDLFVLEPLDASLSDPTPIGQNELIVFSSSQKIADSYVRRLHCAAIRPRKNRETNASLHQGVSDGVQCDTLAGTSASLDRCLYDAGNCHRGCDCSHVSVQEARVARLAPRPEGGARAGNRRERLSCVPPPGSAHEEDCRKNENGNHNELCAWLCSRLTSIVGGE